MNGDEYIKDKSSKEIVKEMKDTADPGSPVFEQMKTAAVVKVMEESMVGLTDAIKSLDKSVGTLDVMLKWVTIVAGIAAAVMAIRPFLS